LLPDQNSGAISPAQKSKGVIFNDKISDSERQDAARFREHLHIFERRQYRQKQPPKQAGGRPPNVACFYVFVSLLPVNGSIYSEDFLSRDSFSHQHGWRFICA
jgi:hypothetical protein